MSDKDKERKLGFTGANFDDNLVRFASSDGILGSIIESYTDKKGNDQTKTFPIIRSREYKLFHEEECQKYAGDKKRFRQLIQFFEASNYNYENKAASLTDREDIGRHYSIAERCGFVAKIMMHVQAQAEERLYAQDLGREMIKYNPDAYSYNGDIELFIKSSAGYSNRLAVGYYNKELLQESIKVLKHLTNNGMEELHELEKIFEFDRHRADDFNSLKDCRDIVKNPRFKMLKKKLSNERNQHIDVPKVIDSEYGEESDDLPAIRSNTLDSIAKFMLYTEMHASSQVYVLNNEGQPEEVFNPAKRKYSKDTTLCLLDNNDKIVDRMPIGNFTREFIMGITPHIDMSPEHINIELEKLDMNSKEESWKKYRDNYADLVLQVEVESLLCPPASKGNQKQY